MATSRDVAKLAGVSPATVSRVFRGENSVTPDTSEAVMAAAHELGYTPNLMASALKKRKSQIVGLLLKDADNPFHFAMARIIEKLLHQKGYRLIISFDDDDFQQSLNTMVSLQVQGVIFIPEERYLQYENYMRLLTESSGIQFLQLYDRVFPGLEAICFQDIVATHQATAYLLEHGHRRILLAGAAGRTEGFYAAYQEIALPPPLPPCDINHDGTEEEIYQKLLPIIREQQPTALFCVGNKFGGAALRALKTLELSFPEDISLLMFDDQDWARWMGITVVAHPIEETAASIVETIVCLCDDNKHKGKGELSPLLPYLVPRTSIQDINSRF